MINLFDPCDPYMTFEVKLLITFENVLGEHRSTTPLALELSKVLLYSVQIFFWFPVLFLTPYLRGHMGSPKEHSTFVATDPLVILTKFG